MTDQKPQGNYLFLSAHLDDAILSCGGSIFTFVRSGCSVEIATIFSGSADPRSLSPLAKEFHEVCKLVNHPMAIRRSEDRKAALRLGAKMRHLGLLECLYRTNGIGNARYVREEEIFHGEMDREGDTLLKVIQTIAKVLVSGKFSEVFVPLGIGRHIDHLLVRKAADYLLCAESNQNSLKPTFYEDLPYACWNRDRNWPLELATSLRPKIHPLSQAAWRAKVEAISCYRSQTRMLWRNKKQMELDLVRYADNLSSGRRVERLWIVKDHP